MVRVDPDDEAILALAKASGSRLIVTGEPVVLNPWEGVEIVRPRDFWPIDRAGGG